MGLYIVSDKTLTSIAEVIREKSGENKKLIFPQDYISTIKRMASSNLDYEFYEGGYNITPTVNPQILYTENKVMENNLNIQSIPYYEVSNDSGKTVYIGGDLNG